jgi:radical SAM superfamily enzyme YgiQ (UPF0313 family)
MRIALIFPAYNPKIFSENLITVDEEFCLASPIILAYVAAILERHGHQVMLLDVRALNLSKAKALERIKAFKPDMLGFRAETYHFHDSLEWIGYLKSHLHIPVITGGINMTLYPKETLSHDEIDYAIVGEAIESLPALMLALENNDDFRRIPGVGYKDKNGNIIVNPPSDKLADFDSYPFPARHLLPNDKYYSFISQRKNFTVMLTSTGCPFKCTFCAIPNTFRVRSPQSVIDEIEVCYWDFNIREIDFFDAVLFMPRDRILEIFHQLKKRKLDLEWSCRSRVDIVDEELLREAASAGCRQIYYGIESIDQKVLNRINKNINYEKVVQAVKLSKKYGIKTMGFFMIGNAGDTVESVRRTMEFAKSLDLDFIQVCRSIAKPGTDLDRELIKTTGWDFWREHVLGNKIKKRLPSPWSSLTEKERASLTKEFYLKFYFRPKIIWRRLSQLKSLSELSRYLRVGLKMLLRKAQVYSSVLTDTSEAERLLSQSKHFLSEAREAKVSVVIPTYNEKDNIVEITSAVAKILPKAYIIIVDDNSPDGTGVIADELSKINSKIHVIHRTGKRGLGLAYRDGFKFVLHNFDSEYIFEMDADFSHNPQYLPMFLHYARSYDLVTGSRFLGRVSIKNRVIWRNVLSVTTKWFVNKFIGVGIKDITTGFKCFNRKTLEAIELDNVLSKGYAFQIELSFLAMSNGFTIKELPILFIERSRGYSKMSLKIILEGFCLVLKLMVRKMLFKNKKVIGNL